MRSLVAIALAPAFTAALISVASVLTGTDPSSRYFSTYVLAFFMIAYMMALAPTALVVLALKAMSYNKLWHFMAAGFVVGFACITIFAFMGYSALLDDFGAWLRRVAGYFVLLPIGPLAGAFVWVVGEWGSDDSVID